MTRWTYFALLAGALAVAVCPPARAEDAVVGLTRAQADASRLAGEARYVEAAALLDRWLAEFPTDYALLLELGRLHLLGQSYASAREFYQRAHDVSGGGLEPRVGLGWVALRQGERDQARAFFEGVLREAPDYVDAQRGLEACNRGSQVQPSVWGGWNGTFWSGHPIKSSSLGAHAGLSVLFAEGAQVGGAWRFDRVSLRGTPLVEPSTFDYHELFLFGGWGTADWGLSATWGLATDDSSIGTFANIFGVVGRYSPYGDLTLGVSVALFDDLNVVRTELAWRVLVGSGFWLRPSLDVGASSDSVGVTGGLTAGWGGTWGNVWAHGRYGDEQRPVYLGVPTIYAITDTLLYAAAAGAEVSLGAGFTLNLTYEWARLRSGDTDPVESNQHGVVLGLSWTLGAASQEAAQ